jgi:uncharacterized repeat protein (TIGR03803 family)
MILIAALPAAALASPRFSIVATVPGGPQIGAIGGNGTILYGTVAYSSPPTLFGLTTAGHYTLLHNFNSATDGNNPNARLAIDGSGNVFGTAPGGGTYGGGTLWEFTAAGKFRTRHAFGGANDGVDPLQGPTLGPKGLLYGSTAMGAPNNNGIVFSMAHSGAYDMVYNFLSGPDGHCPFSGVALSKTETIYGTTVGVGYGGNPNGSVWQYTAAGGLQTLYVFQDGNDGEWPAQAPTVDKDGNVFGTTNVQNGGGFAGAIWKITSGGSFSVLRDLNGSTDGYGPNSPLLLGAHGILYGTTSSGGANGYGTVFSIGKDGAFTVVHAFANNGDGAQPTGNLVRDGNGTIYGGTAYGPVFKIVP